MIFDTLRNLMSGLGGEKDKAAHATFVHKFIGADELSSMHRSDWLSRKIIDIIPDDMTREWRDWKGTAQQIEAIETVEKSPLINLQAKLTLAQQKARLFGGAALFIGVNPVLGGPEEPLDVDRVGKGDLQFLHLLDRTKITASQPIMDVMSEFYGEPEYYTVTTSDGTPIRVHPSRVVRFIGAPILHDDVLASQHYWGDSVLQVVYDAIMNAASAQSNIAALIPEAKTDVIYIPKLSEFLRNDKTTEMLSKRFTYGNSMKSIFNMLLLEGTGVEGDGGERWEQKQINFSQLPEIMRQFLEIVSGAADIPATRFLGQSPGGLDSTGLSDLHNYYDNIGARQRTQLSPALHRLDETIIRSALGTRDPAIWFDWAPLYTLTEKEKADVFKLKADAARNLAGNGTSPPLLPIDALSKALVNEFTEDGTLPGLEEAIEEFGTLAENEPSEEERTAAMLPRPGDRQQTQTADARPKPLYVRRDVLNPEQIREHYERQGLTVTVENLHVTIIYSKVAVDWFAVGEAWDSRLELPAGGARDHELFGPPGLENSLVLMIKSGELEWRHKMFLREGASSDFREYQPHITLRYGNGAGIDNWQDIEPYRGEIILGPEIFEEAQP